MTHEEVTLAAIVREVFVFVSHRSDAVLFGAQAVNAYCEPARMTEDVDLASTAARSLADSLSEHLGNHFHIATRVREVADGRGFRIYQVRKPKNRHLVDVRQVIELPEHQTLEGVRVVTPTALVAMKAISIAARQGREKELSDRLDLARLLRTFPELRSDEEIVARHVQRLGGGAPALDAWRTAALHPLDADDDEVDDEEDRSI